MRSRTLLVLSALAACWALIVPSISWAEAAGHFVIALNTPSSFPSLTQTAQRNSYVVLQPWEGERAAQLKAANPSLVVLAYQNLSAMAQGVGPNGVSSSGVNFAEASESHPNWFLTEADGDRIAESNYPWLWMADIANVGYQQQWTANVIHLLESGPWDGVMADETNTTARYDVSPVSRIAKYPTDAAYEAAVGSMLAYAGPKIQAAGKLIIPNMGSWSEHPEVVKGWLQYVSGGMDEMFVKWASTPGDEGYRDPAGWQTQIEEVQSTEQLGKRFLAVTQAQQGETNAIRYGWASTLLGANGHTAFCVAGNYTGETWSSEFEVPLGEPTSTATAVGNGAWARTFSNGLVLVNPTTTTVDVSFGASYSGSGLSDATAASMAPNTALILTPALGEGTTPGEPTPGPPLPTPGTSPPTPAQTIATPGQALTQSGALAPSVTPSQAPLATTSASRARHRRRKAASLRVTNSARCRRAVAARRGHRGRVSAAAAACRAAARAPRRGSAAGARRRDGRIH